MNEGIEKLRCGGCGKSEVYLYRNKEKEIIAECVFCKSETKLTIKQPVISLDWGDNGNGVLCVF